MKKVLELVDFGSNMRAWAKETGWSHLAKKAAPRPWVAKILDSGNLEFQKGYTDHKKSNSTGTKGVVVRFFLDQGIEYLVCEPLPRGGKKTYRITL
jgi:hypothetical protein